jgi:hypothetical protein
VEHGDEFGPHGFLRHPCPRIRPGAEVIASRGVVGPLAERQYIYPYPFQYHPPGTSSSTFPVMRSVVVFVVTPAEALADAPAAEELAAARFVEKGPGSSTPDQACTSWRGRQPATSEPSPAMTATTGRPQPPPSTVIT